MSNYNDIFSKPYPGIDSFVSNVIKPTFGSSFFTERKFLVSELNESERTIINSVRLLGEVKLTAGDVLQCFDVVLKENVDISRNRVTIQSVVRKVMTSYTAGLMVFHYPDSQGEWRISFVSKGKNVNDSTPAKRYTYLLGEGQPCRTVAERFDTLQVITGERSIENIMEAFSVESLNKDFYSEIATWYYQFCGVDDEQPQFLTLPNANFALPSVKMDYQHFSIRLIGRLLFCWFLKHKKSKNGVPLVPNEILPNLTENKKLSPDFYHKWLEPLFFGCLNTPTNVRERYKTVELTGCWKSVPFLNGGLFSPQVKDYADDAFINTLKIDNDHLSELLCILSSYNFTIDESDPSDIELAVDPEMLGQIFENLLASISSETGSKDMRKKTGSYYTPKVIVDYMSTQSLLALLESKTQLDKTKLDPLFEDNGTHALTPKEVQLVSDTLFNMTILDPACGSGAFPMGVLGMALKVLAKIDPKGEDWKNRLKARFQLNVEIPRYIHKLGLIANCIYGVDIQPFAVEVSKLRAFLSLIVDDTIDDSADNRGIRPLPNLDFKFVAANTLVPLPDLLNKPLLKRKSTKKEQGLFEFAQPDNVQLDLSLDDEEQDTQKAFLAQFEMLAENYFAAACPQDKKTYRQQLEQLLESKIKESHNFIESMLSSLYPDHKLKLSKAEAEKEATLQKEIALLDTYKNIFTYDTVGFFEPQYFFPKVKNGFDIVIGNPPYIQLQNNGGELSNMYKDFGYKTFKRSGDIYALFYERGWQLLKPNGSLCYITSNKWMRSGYGESLRSFLAIQTNPILLIDFAGQQIFKNATVDTNILLFQKAENKKQTHACIVKEKCLDNLSHFLQQNQTVCKFSTSDSWVILSPIEQCIKEKIERIGTPLKDWDIQINRGVLTGFNEAFIIDEATKNRLIEEDPKSADIIRPILRGRDIKRYSYEFANLYLIATFPSMKYDIEEYPAIKKHLLSFGKERLEQTGKKYIINGEQISARKKTNNKWFETQDSINYWDDFYKQKIVWTPVNSEYRFAMIPNGIFFNNSLFMITGEKVKWLLAFFNSKLLQKYIEIYLTTGRYAYGSAQIFESILVLRPTIEIEEKINELVEEKIKFTDNNHIEKSINNIFYAQYNLDQDEIDFIEK